MSQAARKRSLFAGMTDYTGVSMDVILSDLQDWRENTMDCVASLTRLRTQTEQNSEKLDEPRRILSYTDYFIDLFTRYSSDFDRLLAELPIGVRQSHVRIVQQIFQSSRLEERLCVDFTRGCPHDELTDRIYQESRGMIIDYQDLSNLAPRLRTFIGSASMPKGPNKEYPGKSSVISNALAELKAEFLQLTVLSNRNKAGIAVEKMLTRLFELFGLASRPGFRTVGEQIDGSFELDNEVYLVESKWQKSPLPEADLLVFRGKVEGKSAFTRGVFIALNGITSEALKAITRGKAPSFLVVNGDDLRMILDGEMPLTDFLRKRVRLLAEEGRVYVPFSELRQVSGSRPDE